MPLSPPHARKYGQREKESYSNLVREPQGFSERKYYENGYETYGRAQEHYNISPKEKPYKSKFSEELLMKGESVSDFSAPSAQFVLDKIYRDKESNLRPTMHKRTKMAARNYPDSKIFPSPLVQILAGPLKLVLWVSCAPLRVPIGAVYYAYELILASLLAIGSIIGTFASAMKQWSKVLPIGCRFIIRGVCLSGWGVIMFGIYLSLTEKEPFIRPLISEVISYARMLFCAAQHLNVPWTVDGVSEAQLNRAWRTFALHNHPDKTGGISNVYVCVAEALEMLKKNSSVRKFWVISRPLLNISPLYLIPGLYISSCLLMHFWRPTNIYPCRCLRKQNANN